jgi:microcystin-dependent protein
MTKHPGTADTLHSPLRRGAAAVSWRRLAGLIVAPTLAVAGSLTLAPTPASAQATNPGSVAPFSNFQPSLALTTVIAPTGAFPALSGPAPTSGQIVGFVYNFAGGYNPGTTLAANGQSVAINSHITLFPVLGTTYGGNGVSTFALPNLAGRAAMGVGGGNALGDGPGAATVTPGAAQLPVSAGGGGQAFGNIEPSTVLSPLISVGGPFPTLSGPTTPGAANMIGQVSYFAGDFTPVGYLPADGRVLPIVGNQTLFSVLGTTFGGNGVTTFALPDLTGRVVVGADAATPLGAAFGAAETDITAANLGGAPVNDDQPSLALNYLIASSGVFPSLGGGQGFDGAEATLGDVVAFAGDFTPTGYLPADGRLLNISDYISLFEVLGTTYGGNGVTTFALPDLDGRTIIGTGDGYDLGEMVGADRVTLAYTPPVSIPPAGGVPEPASWALMILGFGLAGEAMRRRRRAVSPPRTRLS